MMQLIFKNKDKQVFKDFKTGQVKEVILDEAFKESVRRGDALQPRGKDEKRFFDVYPYLKKDSSGRIYEPIKERQRRREAEEEMNTEERENWHRTFKQKSEQRYWNRNYDTRYQRIFKKP